MSGTGDHDGRYTHLRHRQITNIGHVRDRIIRLHQLGKWNARWVVITQVWTADYLTVAISKSATASLGLRVSDVEVPGLDSLGSASVSAETVSQSGDLLREEGPNMTPFFAGLKLRWLFGDTKPISTGGEPEESVDLEPLHFMDDLMASWSEADDEP